MKREKWDIVRILREDLTGRPFLHEQGNTVTRGTVCKFYKDGGHWGIVVRDVEYLDKTTGQWTFDVAETEYGGEVSRLTVTHYQGRKKSSADEGVEIIDYGIFIYVGLKSDNPWQDTNWPELDTDWIKSGPMYS